MTYVLVLYVGQTSCSWRQFVIIVNNIHATDPSEKWSLWMHGYGKFDMLKLARVCWQRSQFVKSVHCHWTLDRCGALVGLFASTVYSTDIWTSQTERCIPLHAFGHFFFCCEVLKSSSSTFWILPLTPDHPPASSHSRPSVFVLPFSVL